MLAIIPSRSVSKSIKNKNLLKIIDSKSLIEHTYDIAKKVIFLIK
ncbi:cytidylyltransferase domain-containing protein [Candidatus Pelagibacter sp. Uisw_127]